MLMTFKNIRIDWVLIQANAVHWFAQVLTISQNSITIFLIKKEYLDKIGFSFSYLQCLFNSWHKAAEWIMMITSMWALKKSKYMISILAICMCLKFYSIRSTLLMAEPSCLLHKYHCFEEVNEFWNISREAFIKNERLSSMRLNF